MKIYKALYNPSCCESAAATISIHKTKLGAYRAIKESKLSAFNEWLDMHRHGKRSEFRRRKEHGLLYVHSDKYKFDFDQWWGIAEDELQD